MSAPNTPHLEQHLQRDIDVIRSKLAEMASLDEQALQQALQALLTQNRQLAYSIILHDRYVDEMETELDRLCLEFIVRHQPAGGHLRFVYSASKIVKELERVGDYAESIARQVLQSVTLPEKFPRDKFAEIARMSIPMVRDAVQAFVDRNADLARTTMAREGETDKLRNDINAALVELRQQGHLPLEALGPLMTIARRFERAADQAYNICEEAIYYITGEYLKHKPREDFRLVFVDGANSCLSQIAEGIARQLSGGRLTVLSAGLTAGALDPQAVSFLKDKGIDIAQQQSKSVDQVPQLDQVQVIIALSKDALKVFPPPPTKTVGLEWELKDPARQTGTPDQKRAAYEQAYQYLHNNIQDLVRAILGDRNT